MYNIFFCIILFIVILNFIWSQVLASLNRKRMNPDIPAELKGIYDEKEYAKQQAYQKTNSRFGLITGSFSFLLILFVLFSGLLGWLDIAVREYTTHFLLLPLSFFAIILIVNELLDFPFNWYDTFVIEGRFGFNKSSKKIFLVDTLKNILLIIVIGGILLTGILYIYEYTGAYFWLFAWLLVSGFSLIISFFYSEWIVPIFNKQEPLEAGELRDAIETFSHKAGFELKNIYVIDGSKRSSKANAYFTGFGKKKRIVLFDTLLKDLTTEEIVAVLAHEIGHYKKKHVLLSLFMSIISTGITFFVLSFFLDNAMLAKALGGNEASFHLGLVGFSFLFTPISELTGVLLNLISRKNEYEADNYAAGYGLGPALISGLKKLSVKSLSNLNPHPWIVFWHYSHPTLLQRIRKISTISDSKFKI